MRSMSLSASASRRPWGARRTTAWALALGGALWAAGCVVDDGAGGDDGTGVATGKAATVATINTCAAAGVLLRGSYSGEITLQCPLYLIDGDVVFTKGKLVIPPGTAFRAGLNATLWIDGDGAIVADGTKDKPITFAGTQAQTGHWRAFVVESVHPANSLTFVKVEHGGRDTYYTSAKAGLLIRDKVKIAIRDCTFGSNGGSHLYLDDAAELTAFERNTFGAQTAATVNLPTSQAGAIDAVSDYGPAGNFILVRGGKSTADTTWAATSRPRRLDGDHHWESGTWKVAPGVQAEMTLGTTLWVSEQAKLDIVGEAKSPVIFRGVEPQQGHWRAFVVESIHPANRIEHAVIQHGGADTYYTSEKAGFTVKGKAKVSIKATTFRDNAGAGMWVDAAATLTAFEGNTFAANAATSLWVHTANVAKLDAKSNYGDAETDFIHVSGGKAEGGGTWPKTNRPLRLFDDHNLAKGAFVFAPGAHLQLESGATLWVDGEASLVAKGSAAEGIVIEGSQAAVGAWRAFVIESANVSNELAFVTIRHGGGDTYYTSDKAGLYIKNKAVLTMKDCTFADNDTYDFVAESGVKLTPADPKTANTFGGAILIKK